MRLDVILRDTVPVVVTATEAIQRPGVPLLRREAIPGTVFLVVADPEVGSTRRAIAVEAGAVTLVILALVVRRVMVERTPSVESTPAVEES